MSLIALLGAIELGLIYALASLGVYLSFRVLDFPDLTVDGSFPLGASVAAALIVGGVNPWAATSAAAAAGGLAGAITAIVSVKFGVLHLLASILTMTALFSVNLRVMGQPNTALLNVPTVMTPFLGGGVPDYVTVPAVLLVAVTILAAGLGYLLHSDAGLAMRATGANPRMARAQGIRVQRQIIGGIALSNALVGLAGALFAQTQGFADVTLGIGTIVVGLAAVIVGETLLPSRRPAAALVGCVLGSILYRLAVQAALSADVLGLQPSDLNLATAALVLLALVLPRVRRRRTRSA